MQGQILALSFQSAAELWSWAAENGWGAKQRDGLALFLQWFLVIPYDAEMAKTWARVATYCKRTGRRLESGDIWIAATAVLYKIPLLTHDRDHVGLNVQDLNVISYV